LFPATKNDATILSEILENDEHLRNLLKKDDVFILDRGFRDVIDELEKKQYAAHMPALLEKNQDQLTTSQANQSRFVTKVRYVVEKLNAHLKRSFKALRDVQNKTLPHILKDYRIAGALINKYFSRLISDTEDGKEIVTQMKSRLNRENSLMKIVEEHELKKKSNFQKLDAVELTDFPHLDLPTIKTNITLGNYQLKQAIGYIAEHFDNGKYEIRLNEDNFILTNSKIVRVDFRSRHSNATKYRTYIKYLPGVNRASAVEDWYCSCKVGTREVGCCSHIAAIIYYFAKKRTKENYLKPAANLPSIFPYLHESSGGEETETQTQIKSKSQSQTQKKCISQSKGKSKKIQRINRKKSEEFEDLDYDEEGEVDDEDENEIHDRQEEKDQKGKENEKADYEEDIFALNDDECVDMIAELSESFKRHMSTASDIDSTTKKKKVLCEDLIISKIPNWGGNAKDNNCNSFVLKDTCPIDTLLFSIWISFMLASHHPDSWH
jgi:hypothetical protein